MATVTLSTLKADFYRYLGEYWPSTATAGTTSLLTDSALINTTSDTYPLTGGVKGKQVRIEDGDAAGDIRQITGFTPNTGAMAPNRAFSAAPSTASYILCGNQIHLGSALTALFNDMMRAQKPVKHSQVTIVTGQKRYDVTTLVPTKSAILSVYRRRLDSANLQPYVKEPIEWDAEDIAGGGTAAVYLWINALTLDTSAHELWVEHETAWTVALAAGGTGSAFAADADTIDAVYRDWVAWCAVAHFAQSKIADVNADRGYWRAKLDLAASKLRALRPHGLDPQPITIRAV